MQKKSATIKSIYCKNDRFICMHKRRLKAFPRKLVQSAKRRGIRMTQREKIASINLRRMKQTLLKYATAQKILKGSHRRNESAQIRNYFPCTFLWVRTDEVHVMCIALVYELWYLRPFVTVQHRTFLRPFAFSFCFGRSRNFISTTHPFWLSRPNIYDG